MGQKILDSFLFSIEWRFWAVIITTLFLWATTGQFAFALGQALGIQFILLIAHSIWYYLRSEGYIPTFEQLTSWLVRRVVRVFARRR
jgi:hypothetical protein